MNWLRKIGVVSVVILTSTLSTGLGSFGTENYKPIIGINTDVEGDKPERSAVNSQYIAAIRNAGGIPVLLPPIPAADIDEMLKHLDGVLMIGGADYPPEAYKQEKHNTVSLMHKSRSDFDLALASRILKDDEHMPVLGICAGCQALNIASGGSLVQDIPALKPESKIQHSSPDGWKKGFNTHSVEFVSDSKLGKIFKGKELSVVTSHHQCIDSAAQGFHIAAKASDGLTEAIEHEGSRFIIGVQWHPERDFENNKVLFEELVRQAADYHKSQKK